MVIGSLKCFHQSSRHVSMIDREFNGYPIICIETPATTVNETRLSIPGTYTLYLAAYIGAIKKFKIVHFQYYA